MIKYLIKYNFKRRKSDIKGLFDDIDMTSSRLGGSVSEKNKRLADIIEGIGQ